ncbi:hypothetical protein T06_16593 [Trichinella sp. T6]|nr:hypothetical protein T06_16593 [Trichinella sp. T6]
MIFVNIKSSQLNCARGEKNTVKETFRSESGHSPSLSSSPIVLCLFFDSKIIRALSFFSTGFFFQSRTKLEKDVKNEIVKLGVKIVKRIIEREEKKVGQDLFNVTPAKTVPGLSVKRFNACRRRLNWAQKLRVNSVNLVTSWPVWEAWTYVVVVVLSFNLWCETVGGCKFAQF